MIIFKVKIQNLCLLFIILLVSFSSKFTHAHPKLKIFTKNNNNQNDENNNDKSNNSAESDNHVKDHITDHKNGNLGTVNRPTVVNNCTKLSQTLFKKTNETFLHHHHPHHHHSHSHSHRLRGPSDSTTNHQHTEKTSERPFNKLDDNSDDDQVIDDLHGLPRLWKYGIVPYEISHRLYKHRELIEQVMRHISSQAACVQFMKRNDDIWNDYIVIEFNDNDQGCRSHVGRQNGVQQVLLSSSCLNFGTILHELMHVLGFYHEHTRPDRDDYIEILWDNIHPDSWHNFEMISKHQFRNVTEFNYHSIMMYGEYSFSDNFLPTIRPRDSNTVLVNPRFRKKLSHLDIHALQQLYCH